MNQVSPILRRAENGYSHWCPGCGTTHLIPDSGWSFNGNLESPTFQPSVKIEGVQKIHDVQGNWTGGWVYQADGKTPRPYCCHYFVTNGKLIFSNDCTHQLVNCSVPMSLLPAFLRD